MLQRYGEEKKAWPEVADEVGEGVTGWYSSILYPCNRHEWNETFGVPWIVFHVGSHLAVDAQSDKQKDCSYT